MATGETHPKATMKSIGLKGQPQYTAREWSVRAAPTGCSSETDLVQLWKATCHLCVYAAVDKDESIPEQLFDSWEYLIEGLRHHHCLKHRGSTFREQMCAETIPETAADHHLVHPWQRETIQF